MNQYKKVVVLGGKKYIEMASVVFIDAEILTPLKGCKGMGYMMGKLNDAIINNRELLSVGKEKL